MNQVFPLKNACFPAAFLTQYIKCSHKKPAFLGIVNVWVDEQGRDVVGKFQT
jgi:hypothetical protein